MQRKCVTLAFFVLLSILAVQFSVAGAAKDKTDDCGAGASAFTVPFFNTGGSNKNPMVAVLFGPDKDLTITVTDSIENQVLHKITFKSANGLSQSQELGKIDAPELKPKLHLRKIAIAADSRGDTYCSWGQGQSPKHLYIWTPGGNWSNVGKREEFSNPQRLSDEIEAVVSVVPRE